MGLTLLQLDTPAQSEINAAKRAAKSLAARRSYDAARVDRTTHDFVASVTSINRELYAGLRRMRMGSRDLARNNPYARRFFQLLKDNVVGHRGISLQALVADAAPLERGLAGRVERAFQDWGRGVNASASGKLSWLDWQKQAIATIARDGEVLFRVLPQGAHGFCLQQIDVNWLDEQYNDTLRNGHRVLMSVEVDDYYRPQAYYLTPPSWDYYPHARPGNVTARTRVPASEILHLFACEEGEEQVRGVPWLHAAYIRLNREGKYEEAELIAACIEACKMGVVNPPAEVTDEELAVINSAHAEQSVSPGKIYVNQPGWTFDSFDPKRPGGQFEPFVNAILYGVAAGLGVSHASLTGNLSQVNYSSIRWGGLQERDFWRGWQTWLREKLHEAVFPRWLEAAFLAGQLPGVRLADLDQITAKWFPRGWAWVDPQKEINATVTAINNGLDSRTRTVAEEGIDFADLVAELAAENAMAAAAGLNFDKMAASQTSPNQGSNGNE
jgi:lambda family phage portal protein